MVFAPDRGMTFDRYFDLNDDMRVEEKLIAFFVGLVPKAAHKAYTLPGSIDMAEQRGPSLGAGCQLCAAVAAAEVVRILLGKPGLRPAPYYFQFDPFARQFVQGRLWFGNRGPLQRLKRWLMKAKLSGQSEYLQEPRPKVEAPSAPGGGPLAAQVRDYLMRAAIRAPSGDNCQPWRYAYQADTIHLMVDPAADGSFFNVAQAASLISCGAAVENLVLAASRFGMAAAVAVSAADGNARVRVDVSPGTVCEDPLQRFVWERHTNRTLYDGSSLEPNHRLKIQAAIQPFQQAELLLLTEPQQIREAAQLIAGIDRIRAEHRGLHTHLMRMIRFSVQEARERRDGFFLKNLEAGRAGEWFIRCTRPWPVMRTLNHLGMGRMISGISRQGILSASAVGMLKVPSVLPEDLITGGRALERIWLTVASLGLAFQPMTAATLFWLRWQLGGQGDFSPAHRRLLKDLWPRYQRLFGVTHESEGHVMLFRVGKGRPVGCRTLRKPLAAFRLPWPFEASCRDAATGGPPKPAQAAESIKQAVGR
jgi:nitroreductase